MTSAESTAAYARRFPDAAPNHFRPALGLTVGSIGMGTYLGPPDESADESYSAAMVEAVMSGCNVIDSAANYRFQRSERAIGEGLRRLAARGFSREEVVLCTKGGFIPFDGDVPDKPRDYFTDTFIRPGIATQYDLVAGMHCMTPAYLRHQIDASLSNLGVEHIDVYYIHNPETQFKEIARDDFHGRLRAAFESLERAAADGVIGVYGCATWHAFRVPPDDPEHISIARLVSIAREIAGDRHKFRAVQLPYNLNMRQAADAPTQVVDVAPMSTIEAAHRLGLVVFTSVPIHQGRLTYDLPAELQKQFPGLSSDAQRAIQFVRSTPHVTAALVGMSASAHVKENLSLRRIAPVARNAA